MKRATFETNLAEPTPKRMCLTPNTKLAQAAQNIKSAVTCCLELYKFKETVNKAIILKLKQAGLLRTQAETWETEQERSPEATHLTKWCTKIKKNVARVKYKRTKHKYGRVQPLRSQSLGSIRGEVKAAVCGDDYVDIDVKNCHPTMLLQICKALDIPCPALQHYVHHRDDCCLAKVQALYKDEISTKQAYKASKTLFIRMMYGGRATEDESLLKDPKAKLPDCTSNLQREIPAISAALQGFNPDSLRCITREKSCDKVSYIHRPQIIKSHFRPRLIVVPKLTELVTPWALCRWTEDTIPQVPTGVTFRVAGQSLQMLFGYVDVLS
jgi:hypothetical protein